MTDQKINGMSLSTLPLFTSPVTSPMADAAPRKRRLRGSVVGVLLPDSRRGRRHRCWWIGFRSGRRSMMILIGGWWLRSGRRRPSSSPRRWVMIAVG
jgi:hypothetical protein